nr:RHS repeat-associated core domain-containing protein [uncultured Porphyromonas sp.]
MVSLRSSLGSQLSYERNAYGELVCFRYYNPELGRYISQDPIRLEGGVSLYGYAESPSIVIDVYGLYGTPKLPPSEILREGGLQLKTIIPKTVLQLMSMSMRKGTKEEEQR